MKEAFFRVLLCITAASLMAACNKKPVQSSNQPTNTWQLSSQAFIHQGFSPQVGDEVWARLLDETGHEIVFERIPITQDNLGTWPTLVAQQLNEGSANAYMRVRQDPTGETTGESGAVADSNYVWLANPKHTYILGLDH